MRKLVFLFTYLCLSIASYGQKGNLAQYDKVNSWQRNSSYGYCEVYKNGKAGLIDKNDIEVIPCIYDKIDTYCAKMSKGTGGDIRYFTVLIGEKKGLYDIVKKQETVPCIYDGIQWWCFNVSDYCVVEKNGKKGIVNNCGEEIVPCIYEGTGAAPFQMEREFCEVVKNNKYGIINIKGEEIIPCIYDYTSVDNNDYAIVEKGCLIVEGDECDYYKKYGLCGIVDLQDRKEIIPCKYNYIQPAGENLFTFNINGKRAKDVEDTKVKNGKWGCVDTNNEVVIQAEYDNPILFKDGAAQVQKKGVSSLIEHPITGTSISLVRNSSIVDTNIPKTPRKNENAFAFIIANESYINFTGADFSINDGKIFKEYCSNTLGIPEKNIRYYEDITYGNLIGLINKMKDIADVYEGDAQIIFYYSGLGGTDVKTKDSFLLPVDCSITTMPNTGYSIIRLQEIFNNFNTQSTIAIIDASFSNVDKNGKVFESGRGVQIKPKVIHPTANTIFLIGSDGQSPAYSSKKYNHGLLTHAILQKLQDSKGNCNLQDLFEHTVSWVKKESVDEFDNIQSPLLMVSPKIEKAFSKIKF